MSNSNIKEGSVVTLKSGSQLMTVSWVNEKSAYCVWAKEDGLEGKEVPLTVLRLVSMGEGEEDGVMA